MEHRHQAEEDHDVDQEPEDRHDPGEPVVDQHERDHEKESEKAGHDAAPHRVRAECRGDAPGFLDLHRHAQRVFESAGELAGFLVREVAGDLGVAKIVVALQDRRGEDLAVQDDRHLVALVLRGDLVKNLRALGVELEGDPVALLVKKRERAGDVLAGERGPTRDQDLGDILGVLGVLLQLVGLEHVGGRHDFLARPDPRHMGIPARIDHRKFEFGNFLELGPGLFGLLRVQAGDLDKNPVLALRADDRLAHAELIHALADDFDRLVQQVFRDPGLGLRDQLDEE